MCNYDRFLNLRLPKNNSLFMFPRLELVLNKITKRVSVGFLDYYPKLPTLRCHILYKLTDKFVGYIFDLRK